MTRYSSSASSKVKQALHEQKRGTLKSGRSEKTVKSRRQAIAIGLSAARKAGAKVPARTSKRRGATKKSVARKPASRRRTARRR